MALFTLLAASLVVAPPQTSTVTFETKAEPLDKAMAGLSATTGLKMECTPDMDPEIVILSLHDAPVKEVLQRLARVTSGMWAVNSGKYVLMPDHKTRDDEKARGLQSRTDKYRETLKKRIEGKEGFFDRPVRTAPSPSGNNEQPEVDLTSPRKIFSAIYAQIDPAQLATMSENGRIVYSTSPNALQLPISVPADVLRTFIDAHNALAASMPKETEQAQQQMQESFPFPVNETTEQFKPIKEPPSKVLFAISRQQSMLQGRLLMFDSKGKVLYRAEDMLGLEMYGMNIDSMSDVSDMAQPPKPEPAQGATISYGPTSKELMKMSEFGRSGTMPKLSDDARRELMHPDAHDPLSFTFSDAAIATATDRHDQLIGDIPDEADLVQAMGNNPTTTGQFFNRIIDKHSPLAVSEKDGWLELAPSHPAEAREFRFDRKAMEDLLAAAQQHGNVTLDDVAAYALRTEPPSVSSVSMGYFFIFLPDAMQILMGKGNEWPALRFYGTLSPQQRQSSRLAFRSMSADQIALIGEMVYGANSNLQTAEDATKPKNAESLFEEMMPWSFTGHGPTDYRNEPTEAFPNGVPSDGYLDFVLGNKTVVKAADSTNTLSMVGGMDAQMYGLFSGLSSFMQQGGMKLDRLKVGKRAELTLKFELGSGIELKKVLHEDNFAPDAEAVTPKDLPEDFLKAADEAAKKMKKLSEMANEKEPAIPPL